MRVRSLMLAAAGILSAAIAVASAQGLVSQRKVISSLAAKRIVDSCMEFGARGNVALAIAVVDPAGNLLSFQAMEGATETASLTAQLKAKTAARWRRPTAELFDRVNNNVNRAPEFVGDFPQGGGYPLFVEGELVGAVGAGGGAGTADNDCAEHAIRTVFGASAVAARP